MRRTSSISLASAFALAGCVSGELEKSRVERAKVAISTLEMAAELEYLKNGKYPAKLAEIPVQHREDPWGHPFVYAVKGSSLEIYSVGPDGVGGNDDDVREKWEG